MAARKRRVTYRSTNPTQPNPTNTMSSTENNNEEAERSPMLASLAERLRLYRCSQNQNSSTEEQNGLLETVDTTSESTTLARAAVLVCIFQGNQGDLRLFLTKRSSSLSSNSGDVALPGGKREQGDADDVETALREAKEEIGLDPCLVDVVTVLEPFFTKRGIMVVPVVGILYNKEAFCPVLNAEEVESIFDVPLDMFLKNENRREEERQVMGESYLLHYFDYQSGSEHYVIWALTARILISVASVVFGRPPEFPERRPNYRNRAAKPSRDIPKP